jgi:hypothetical protein
MQGFLKETEATARKLGIELQLVQALYAAEFENAFSAMVRWNADADRAAKPHVVRPAPTHRGVGREKPAAGNVSGERVCRLAPIVLPCRLALMSSVSASS